MIIVCDFTDFDEFPSVKKIRSEVGTMTEVQICDDVIVVHVDRDDESLYSIKRDEIGKEHFQIIIHGSKTLHLGGCDSKNHIVYYHEPLSTLVNIGNERGFAMYARSIRNLEILTLDQRGTGQNNLDAKHRIMDFEGELRVLGSPSNLIVSINRVDFLALNNG